MQNDEPEEIKPTVATKDTVVETDETTAILPNAPKYLPK
jgi:hypothetical protein